MSWQHLPRDTKLVVRDRIDQCRNLGLILDRFNPWVHSRGKWDFGFQVEEWKGQTWRPRTATGGEAKGLWLSDWRGDRRTRPKDEPLLIRPRIDSGLLNAYHARWAAHARACGADPFDCYTATRLAVGLGAGSVLETSLTLHRIYGFPIIPGSALKGITRLVALVEVAQALGVPALSLEEYWKRKPPGDKPRDKTPLNKLDTLLESSLIPGDERAREQLRRQVEDLKRDRALPDTAAIKDLPSDRLADDPLMRDFQVVFGTLGQAGDVIFFTAVPAEPPSIVPDVMNPHYPNYYQGVGFPDDGDQPNPISFLSVAEGTRFSFAVAPRRPSEPASQEAAQRSLMWLAKALADVGIGAKTGAGYGLFSDHRPVKFEAADPEPRPPAPLPDPPPEDEEDEQDEEEYDVSDFAKRFARFLGTEE